MARQNQKLFRYAVDTFVELLGQVTNRKVKYKCNDQDTESWKAFLEEFPKTIGEDFVKKFVFYGIQSWFNSGSEKDYSRSIRFNWIFGKTAISRWRKFDVGTNMYITRIGLKRDHNINIVKRESNISKFINSLRPVEEKFKSELHNTKRGFLWCIANTTLYNHKSSWCATCEFKKQCKVTLKREYPKIYIKRGYGEKE